MYFLLLVILIKVVSMNRQEIILSSGNIGYMYDSKYLIRADTEYDLWIIMKRVGSDYIFYSTVKNLDLTPDDVYNIFKEKESKRRGSVQKHK